MNPYVPNQKQIDKEAASKRLEELKKEKEFILIATVVSGTLTVALEFIGKELIKTIKFAGWGITALIAGYFTGIIAGWCAKELINLDYKILQESRIVADP